MKPIVEPLAPDELPDRRPSAAPPLLVLVCGLAATWIAAGSLGWIAPPLAKSLTWLALGTAILFAPVEHRTARNAVRRSAGWQAWPRWQPAALIGAAAVLALLLTASALTVATILAVVVVMAAIAQTAEQHTARLARSVALAALVLAAFRAVCDSTACGWTFAQTVGRCQGHCAALLTDRPLAIGASFGGLDFLVVMAMLGVAVHPFSPRPRFQRFLYYALAVVAAQTLYLVVLAFSPDIAALLPAYRAPVVTDSSHLGLWTWSNALHIMLPWQLPLLAGLLHAAVAVVFCRLLLPRGVVAWGSSQAMGGSSSANMQRSFPAERTYLTRRGQTWLLAPAGLLVVAAVAVGLAPVKSDLTGCRIVAYDAGGLDWGASDPGDAPAGAHAAYGLLPALVEDLGGEFVVSRDLNADDLRAASVVVLLPTSVHNPRSSVPAAMRNDLPKEIRQRLWAYVQAGGSLLVAGGADENALIEPSAMQFRDDMARSLTDRWEDNLAGPPHAATASSRPGECDFSIDRAETIRVAFPAAPLLVGRWGWSDPGDDHPPVETQASVPRGRLGDLVLAAQQNVGRGQVVALGDSVCLSNDGLPYSYTFCAPLLASLAEKESSPLALWRQLAALAATAAAVAMLIYRCEPLPLAAAAFALALTTIACNGLNDARASLLPAAGKPGSRPVVYVDGSHLEMTAKNPWCDDGLGRFMRVLASCNSLPLVAPDLSAERLARAAMLVSVAPGRGFGRDDTAAVKSFVEKGGKFFCTVGSPDAEPSRALLKQFQLQIDRQPVPPGGDAAEPEPLGPIDLSFAPDASVADLPSGASPRVQFYAPWPVAAAPNGSVWPIEPEFSPVFARNPVGNGLAVLLGDSGMALQKAFAAPPNPDDSKSPPPPRNAAFWQTVFRLWLK